MASEASRVLVTGASGFVASHIILQLQQEGYKVRGTVRNLKNEEKLKPLYELCPDTAHQLELVEADLLNEDSWPDAVKDCEYVLHVASPFPCESPDNESELIKPAVDGTLNVLKAATAIGGVKRVVLTSSAGCVSNGCAGNAGHDDKVPYTEDEWTDTTAQVEPYVKSKILAEKAAWDYVKEHTDDEDMFELVVLNPAYLIGPVLYGGSPYTSLLLQKWMMEREMVLLPKCHFPMIDVRDVATAHVSAMKVPEAAGHRHILYSGGLWVQEMAKIIEKEFDPQGYNIPTTNAPSFLVKFVGLFDKTMKIMSPSLDKNISLDNTRMKDVLGVKPRDLSESVIDTCYSLAEFGIVKKAAGYRSRKDV